MNLTNDTNLPTPNTEQEPPQPTPQNKDCSQPPSADDSSIQPEELEISSVEEEPINQTPVQLPSNTKKRPADTIDSASTEDLITLSLEQEQYPNIEVTTDNDKFPPPKPLKKTT